MKQNPKIFSNFWHPDEGIEDELSMECDSSITEQGLGTSNLFLGM